MEYKKHTRMVAKLPDGTEELVTVISTQGRYATVRDPFGYVKSLPKKALRPADESVAHFTGNEPV